MFKVEFTNVPTIPSPIVIIGYYWVLVDTIRLSSFSHFENSYSVLEKHQL